MRQGRRFAGRVGLLALPALAACDVSSTVGYNDGALSFVPGLSCAADAPLHACATGTCVATEFAEAERGIQTMAVDSENVYFLSDPDVISKRALSGGPEVELTRDMQYLNRLTSDADTIYWAENNGGVRSVPKAGGPVAVVTDVFGHPTVITNDADHVYVTMPETGEVAMAPKPSGPDTRIGGQNVPWWIAVDDTHVYWINQGQAGASNGELVRAPRGDLASAEVMQTGLDAPVVLTVTADEVLWASYDTIYSVAKAGGPVETVATGFRDPKGLAVFDGIVYFAGETGLSRTDPDGTTLNLEPRALTSLAVGCDGIYGTGWYEHFLLRYGK